MQFKGVVALKMIHVDAMNAWNSLDLAGYLHEVFVQQRLFKFQYLQVNSSVYEKYIFILHDLRCHYLLYLFSDSSVLL